MEEYKRLTLIYESGGLAALDEASAKITATLEDVNKSLRELRAKEKELRARLAYQTIIENMRKKTAPLVEAIMASKILPDALRDTVKEVIINVDTEEVEDQMQSVQNSAGVPGPVEEAPAPFPATFSKFLEGIGWAALTAAALDDDGDDGDDN
jgi:hypothetical protein